MNLCGSYGSRSTVLRIRTAAVQIRMTFVRIRTAAVRIRYLQICDFVGPARQLYDDRTNTNSQGKMFRNAGVNKAYQPFKPCLHQPLRNYRFVDSKFTLQPYELVRQSDDFVRQPYKVAKLSCDCRNTRTNKYNFRMLFARLSYELAECFFHACFFVC